MKIRMMALMSMEERELLCDNLDAFCINKSRITGALREYKDGTGSLDYVLASFATPTLPPLADSLCE